MPTYGFWWIVSASLIALHFALPFLLLLFRDVKLHPKRLRAVAIYLLVMPIKHFLEHSQHKEAKPVGASFWRTVIAVEITDVAFAIDSVLAGVTFVNNDKHKIWVVYCGAIIGIVLLRFAASLFIKLLDRFPALDHVAYVLVGWVGVKLAFLAGANFSETHPQSVQIPHMNATIFWSGLISIALIGSVLAVRRGAPKKPKALVEPPAEPLSIKQEKPEEVDR